MDKKVITLREGTKDRSFDLLIEQTLKSLKKEDRYGLANEAAELLSKPQLLALVKSFSPDDSIELLLVLQFIIGYLWSTERLAKGHSFSAFTNLCLRASDLLIRYKALKMKNPEKNAIPHVQAISTLES